MTVAELIGILETLDPSLQVVMPSELDFHAIVTDARVDTVLWDGRDLVCLTEPDFPGARPAVRLFENGVPEDR